jgi:hypothetical protein
VTTLIYSHIDRIIFGGVMPFQLTDFPEAVTENSRAPRRKPVRKSRLRGPSGEKALPNASRSIYVTNKLPESTNIHWHGVLVPSGMDGVAGLSQKNIAPGETYKYEFQLRQHGTYNIPLTLRRDDPDGAWDDGNVCHSSANCFRSEGGPRLRPDVE